MLYGRNPQELVIPWAGEVYHVEQVDLAVTGLNGQFGLLYFGLRDCEQHSVVEQNHLAVEVLLADVVQDVVAVVLFVNNDYLLLKDQTNSFSVLHHLESP